MYVPPAQTQSLSVFAFAKLVGMHVIPWAEAYTRRFGKMFPKMGKTFSDDYER